MKYVGSQNTGSSSRLYYYKARVYHPELGRFMQTDPIGYEDGMNWYAYVGNDPINGKDPTGLFGKFKEGWGIDFSSGYMPNDDSNDSDTSDGDSSICQSTCKTFTTSAGGGVAVVSGEGGTMYVYDPNTGLVHVFDYAAGGIGLGIGGAVSAELGVLSPTTIDDVSGWGLGVSGFIAAYHGASGQIYGSSYFNDSGTMGGGTGYAFGGGLGASGLLTRTWYRNSAPLISFPKLEGTF